jgi:hypothetical protein
MHTGCKSRGGYFAKIPKGGGGQVFLEKLPGGSTHLAFYSIFVYKFFKNLPGGCCFIPPPSPPLCASMCGQPFWCKGKIIWKKTSEDMHALPSEAKISKS